MSIRSSRRTIVGTALLCAGLSAACEDFCPRGYTKIEGTCYRNKDAGVLDGSTDTVEREADERDDLESDTGVTPPELDAESSGGSLDDAGVPAFDASDEVSPGNDGSTVESDAATPDAPVSDAGPDSAATADAAVIDCSSQPCQNGGTCTDGPEGFACACAEPFVGNQCELQICGSMTIQSQADLEAAQDCNEIRGNLQLFGGTTEINASHFPHLARVTGDLIITNRQAPGTERITLGSLAEVGGKVEIVLIAVTTTISFPMLTTIGTAAANARIWIAQAPTLGRIEMPKLTAVHGDVVLQHVTKLCSLHMPKVANVSGGVTLIGLPNAPYSDFARLVDSPVGALSASQVGCCVLNDSFGCSGYSSGCPPLVCP